MNYMFSNNLCRKNIGPVKLAFIEGGVGEPIIFIHGSWDDHNSWDKVFKILQQNYRVIAYDRRGHSASTNIDGQGSIYQDVNDVIGLMGSLGLDAAHIIGHSYGANIAIALCGQAPKKIKSIFIHEPPIFSLLNGTENLEKLKADYLRYMKNTAALIEEGYVEEAAKLFIENVAFGQGAWSSLFDECARRSFLANADTWLDQFYDPDRLSVDVNVLAKLNGRVTISIGTNSLEPYELIAKRIEKEFMGVKTVRIEGAGHGAHISHPSQIANEINNHIILNR